MGLAWLSLHLVEHYAFTQDEKMLKETVYPILKEVFDFFEDYLSVSPGGDLVTGPSLSPENTYQLPDGQQAALCMGPTMDLQILRELCKAFLDLETRIEVSEDEQRYFKRIQLLERKLPPIKIGKYGQIMEWQSDYEEVEKGHRHISQLFGLHPGSQITGATPELMKAAKCTLERRLVHGGGHTDRRAHV